MPEITKIEDMYVNLDTISGEYNFKDEKPKNIPEYQKWLFSKFNEKNSHERKRYYESVFLKAEGDFKKSNFWIQLTDNFKKYSDDYSVKTGYTLFSNYSSPELKPEILVKPYDSFILKTFRYNVINNNNWPNEPEDGWIPPSKGFSKINDLLRTLIVVKYLDGVDYIVEKIKDIDSNCKVEFKAKDDGYYAAHVYIKQTFEIPEFDWNTRKEDILIEIQITTQLQEVIRKLLHQHYEENRKKIEVESTKWQWDYKCDQFASNYLGHILHYIEGMIMDIRDKQDIKKFDTKEMTFHE